MRRAAELAHALASGEDIGREGLIELLGARGDAAAMLHRYANLHRKRLVGDVVHIRGIIEFSNHCHRMCKYCGLRAGCTDLPRYRMNPGEIVLTAERAAQAGYRSLVLQSGEDPWYTQDIIATLVRDIKLRTGMAITLSVGERPLEEYRAWRDAGADKVLIKHETSDPVLYASLHPGNSTLKERAGLLRDLRELGYEAGGGFMVGLPGQTLDTLADDLLLVRDIGCSMAGMGPFLPSPGTPLGNAAPGSVELSLNVVAAARLLIGNIHLPATSSLNLLARDGGKGALQAGANVLMNKVEPKFYQNMYQIYPRGRKEEQEPEWDLLDALRRERAEVDRRVRDLGRIPI